MNLYLITYPGVVDYDYYEGAVVAAETEDDAKSMHPRDNGDWDNSCWVLYSERERVEVELIGTTNKEKGVIFAAYNAG